MIDFAGKTLLLTGANGGITRSVAEVFNDLNASMVLTDLDRDAVAGFARGLPKRGGRAVAAAVDVADSAAVDAACALARGEFGGIDVLVTGAGLYLDQPVEAMTDAQWRQALAVNLDGVFHACRAAARVMRDGGAIVNIASMAGHRGSNRHAHYAAAKGAVLSFSRSLAHELAPRGIRVNCVSPGLIDTPMIRPVMEANGPALIGATPLRRLGRPEEVAKVVAFLCSDWASFVTGETVHINGGLYVAS